MVNEKPSVFFFDIGDTLGTVRFNDAQTLIERIDVFPDVPDALRTLSQSGARLGIISNRGSIPPENVTQALEQADILSFFTPALIFFGKKDSPAIFLKAAAEAGHEDDPQKCLFVGENQGERAFASEAGLLVAETPQAALKKV